MSVEIPGGAQTISKMRGQFPGAYPHSLIASRGARVVASSGDVFVDWICALGAVGLGHSDEAVTDAVRAQLHLGPIHSLPDVDLEMIVAELLHRIIPCAEAVRFVKTGSESTEAAIRIARAHTGRDIVLTCGYHGWHSWYAATRPQHPGVPEAMTKLVRTFRYNAVPGERGNLEEVAGGLFGVGAANVAAVILEPTLLTPPNAGWLEWVREYTTRIGAVLIFDEMITGFRWHQGGAQTLYGVTPDLATFGKALGNGFPIGLVAGRRDIMRHAVLVSGTFNGDCIGLAAANAVLLQYWRHDVCGHMARLGRRLIDGYNAAAKLRRAPTQMVGQPPHPKIVWTETDEGPAGETPGAYEADRVYANKHRASLFFQEVVKRGHLVHPAGLNIMYAHSEKDVDDLLDACAVAMDIVLVSMPGRVVERIHGHPIDPGPAWRVTN